MPRPKSTEPKYCRHTPSGRAFVTLNGHRMYLGKHGTQESRDRYHRALVEWQARGREPVVAQADGDYKGPTVTVILGAFWLWAETYYRAPEGSSGGELENYKIALRPLRQLYGTTLAAEFGPLKLKALMQQMVLLGWSRTYLNRQVGRVKAVFRWAVGEELIPGAVHQALVAVAGLRKGKCAAPETPKVRPAGQEQVDALLAALPRHLRAMVDLQLLTGCRPGELCIIRTGDVDRTDPIWTYRPRTHKTSHLDEERIIDLGPKAQKILQPFLKLDPEAFLFSPAEAEAERREAQHAARQTPTDQGNVPGSNRKPNPKRAPGQRYTTTSYRRALRAACEKLFGGPAEDLCRRRVKGAKGKKQMRRETLLEWRERLGPQKWQELRDWQRKNRVRPHQLRHNAATALRRDFGIDVARIILGHKTDDNTSLYAERDRQKARDVMGRVG